MSSGLIWLMLLAHAATLSISTDENISDVDVTKTIFILAGQSNMAGRASVINDKWFQYVPPECTPNPLIQRLSANLTWEEARDPLHQDIDVDNVCGIGPGMPFANSVLEKDFSVGVIGLVPCAVGETSIAQWSKGQDLYNQLLRRAEAAVISGSSGGVVRAILWFQGEADAETAESAQCYKEKLEKFFTDVRSDLQVPELPIIQVALGSTKGNYTEEVRKAQLGIELPNVRCVDAKGLPLTADNLHLNTDGQIKVGRMMADAFIELRASSVST